MSPLIDSFLHASKLVTEEASEDAKDLVRQKLLQLTSSAGAMQMLEDILSLTCIRHLFYLSSNADTEAVRVAAQRLLDALQGRTFS